MTPATDAPPAAVWPSRVGGMLAYAAMLAAAVVL